MLLLSEFTQIRLAAFLVGHNSGLPLRHLPIYAEAVLAPIEGSSDSPFERYYPPGLAEDSPRLVEILEGELRRRIKVYREPESFEDITQFIQSVVKRLEELRRKDPLPDGAVEKVRVAVDYQAGEVHWPWPEKKRQRQSRVVPMGLLATDHAGFASWDIERLSLPRLVTSAELESTQVDFWLYPNLMENTRISASDQRRIAPDAVVVRIEVPDA